jgi:ribosome-associated protein
LSTPIPIPRHRLSVRASHSGGPGGQNVNKVATRIELRFGVDDADWIPVEVRERFKALERARINAAGEWVTVSSRHRVQSRNLEDCLAKLRAALEAASRRPKRRIATKPGAAARKRRLDEKRQRGFIKRERRGFEGD